MLKELPNSHELLGHIQQELGQNGQHHAVGQIVVKEDGAAHQHGQRDHGVPRGRDAALVHVGDIHQLFGLFIPFKGRAAAAHPGVGLSQRADLGKNAQRQQQAQQDHAQGIDHAGDGAEIVLKAQPVLAHQPHGEGRPAGKWDGHAQAAGHEIGLQGQMLSRNAVLVGDLPHGERHRQGVQIFVHEHNGGHEPCQHQRPPGAGGHLQQQVAEAHEGAGLLKQGDHAAEADDDAQHELVRRVGQRGVQRVNGAGEEVLAVQQDHGQQRGEHHGIRHFTGLQGVDNEKCQGCKGRKNVEHEGLPYRKNFLCRLRRRGLQMAMMSSMAPSTVHAASG